MNSHKGIGILNMLPKRKTYSTLLILLTALVSASPLFAADSENSKSVTIIKPQKKVPLVDAAAIDTEKFELGFSFGSLSVEDFGTNNLTGASFAYHVSEDFFMQASFASADVDKATFEEVVDQDFLSNADREFSYTQLLAGYQVFYGRSFLGKKQKFNSHLYLTVGLENVEFAGEKELGYVIGTTYKVVVTDWLTWNFNLNNHMFERSFLADKKLTNNIELSIGLSALF